MSKLPLAALALAALVASTSIASAMPLKPNLVLPVGNASSGVVLVPIKVDPKPRPHIQIPGVIDKDPPAKPHLPNRPPIIVKIDHGKATTNKPTLRLDCLVKDTVPTTDDLWIVNVGEAELPLGLKIRFSVPSTGDHGAFLLNRSIAAGQKVKVVDLLHGAQSGAPCRAQIL